MIVTVVGGIVPATTTAVAVRDSRTRERVTAVLGDVWTPAGGLQARAFVATLDDAGDDASLEVTLSGPGGDVTTRDPEAGLGP